jgi:hypothetical protein
MLRICPSLGSAERGEKMYTKLIGNLAEMERGRI